MIAWMLPFFSASRGGVTVGPQLSHPTVVLDPSDWGVCGVRSAQVTYSWTVKNADDDRYMLVAYQDGRTIGFWPSSTESFKATIPNSIFNPWAPAGGQWSPGWKHRIEVRDKKSGRVTSWLDFPPLTEKFYHCDYTPPPSGGGGGWGENGGTEGGGISAPVIIV